MVDLERTYKLAPWASIRPERFGGLIYRYDNRALYFVHSRPLVDFLAGLDGGRPLGRALREFADARRLMTEERQGLEAGLAQLHGKGILYEL
jgi:putative mycofactocin binding protein MftB